MKARRIKYTICLCSLILCISLTWTSCSVTKPYQLDQATVNKTLYRDITTNDTTTIADIPWKQLFSDTLLQGLISEGIQNNLDLKIAAARIKAAEANFVQSKSAFFPSLSANISAAGQQLSAAQAGHSQTYQFYLGSGWEVGLWGKLKSARRSAQSALLESEAYKRAVQTQLISDIAMQYYNLIGYDAQLAITEKTIENRRADVETMKILKESNVVTGAAVVQSQANQYSAEVTVPDLKQHIRETENAISILLGRNPGPVHRDSLLNEQIRTGLETGVPLQLLANRPDVQQAEYQLRYYAELTNVAKTYFYPSLTITGESGLYANNLSQLFNASSFFANVLGGLAQPLFNNGLNKQRLQISKANQEEYLYTFQQALLNAGEEVSNALFDYQAASDKMKTRSQQITYLQRSVEYTRELLKYTANTNYTDVLTSEQSLLAAQLSGVSDKLQQLEAVVTLYRSLGGGWK